GLYAVISLFAEFIASLLVIWLKTVPDLLVHAYSGNYMMAVIISKLLLFMMIFLLVSRKKDYEIQLLPQVFHSILFTIPIFSCVILLCNMDSYYFVYSDKVAIKIIGLLSLLYINVIVFFIFNKCNEMAAKIMESRLISQEIAYKDAYYRTVEKNQMELREVRHNLKNQLLGIKHVLQQSGDENASKILEELGNFETKIYSENPVIHSIVECKLQEAKKAGIEDIKVDIRVPKQVQISCGDLGIVIGNLLDNAIEGNQELEKKERALDIEMCYLQKNFLLKIENPISQKQKQAYQKGKTRKLDKINHGIGLKSVEKILKSYNSHMEIECNDTFCVNIMFMNV
ncbi:MAG: GHKL domain-containing protein, partial [Lachnospiraceae bacterium]|nr:GHKL domain-containing protein [Lachnospiraceae bacterium]